MRKLELINMSEITRQEVDWLWYPYIPFGKVTIVQGDPGEGKTMLLMSLIARLSNGKPVFGQEDAREPMTCIYQTAEDGLADTIKPRLEDAGADCRRVFVIDESKSSLSFTDDRIEQAIVKTGAKLLIFDPLQAYLGAAVDMHRANEVRPAFHALGGIAQRTGCAIVLIGHMNKTKGQGGLYRGLGSIDIAGAARSILLVRRLADGSDVLCLAHIKSNLEELGVDRLFVDEAHYYKNLAAFTKMRNVGGISQTEAMKSSDLYMKCRYLDEITGGRGVVFATGTPISNSMVEMYTMQKYLQYHTLETNDLMYIQPKPNSRRARSSGRSETER